MLKKLPSNAPRWVPCPGSVSAEARFPRPPQHPDAAEGDAAHWANAQVLKSWHPSTRPMLLADYRGATAPNGRIITAEIIESGQLYLDTIWERAHEHPAGITAECWVDAGHLIPGLAGPADCKWESPDHRYITIYEYKNGVKPVAAYQNYQLLSYALGIAHPRILQLELVVVQPRQRGGPGPVRRWFINTEKLHGYGLYMQGRAKLVDSPSPPTHAGPWCRHCRAAGECDTLDAASAGAMDAAGDALGTELTNRQVAFQLAQMDSAKEMVRARLDALEALAVTRIKGGGSVPGFAYEGRLGNRRWRRHPNAIYAFGALFGIDLRESKPCTPLEATRRGIGEDTVNTLTERPENPPKLIRADPITAMEVFSNGDT